MNINTLKYLDILKLNKELTFDAAIQPVQIKILSNISVQQSKELLEFVLKSESIPVTVEFGDYDNIIQDSLKYKASNVVILFWEACNILDGLQYTDNLLSNDEVNGLIEKTKQEIDLVIKNLENTPLVLFNKFSSSLFSFGGAQQSNFKKIADSLNHYLIEKVTGSAIKLVDIDNAIASVGTKNSLNLRYFASSKALYTIDFFKEYAQSVAPYIRAANGRSKKALIFDCDNTLWNGILGEDGFDGIDMSKESSKGKNFHQVQSLALALSKRGILIGLCSKNNPGDVDEVISKHPDMILRDENITIKKVNWNDKVTNLKEIAAELNIGLDSLVFVDDSSFEANFIIESLPEVTMIQVPEKTYEYPFLIQQSQNLFYNLSYTKEDMNKTEIYKQQAERENQKKVFASIDDYLRSLELNLTIYKDDISLVPRLAQMTQKTNQFNLTTKRYTEPEIVNFMQSPGSSVFAFSVKDKFGDNGITGLSIIKLNEADHSAEIDTFLLSCRIIGRNLELAIVDHLITDLKNNRIESVIATYMETKKNDQVKDFYKQAGFGETITTEKVKNYSLSTNEYKYHNLDYIQISYGKID
jgi:FkbH-like protein